MSAGLCSVLKSIRGSMDSDSDSDNDHDVTDDVDPPSWHGSMQHLTSTSESEAGNCSSESFMCDHCGRHSSKGDNNSSNNSSHSRTSGRPPFPSGRKRGVRPKKRAHFAVDTDNSSDNADKMSDSHESSPCSTTFKPISGPSQMVLSTSRRGSLSPREIKPACSSDNHNSRPSQSFTRSNSLSTSSDRGRQPFKANHELFKLPPSGPSTTPSSASGKPALPPRQIHRNHFKLQRRNSISNEERSKLPLQTGHGKCDGRPLRSASATREINSKCYENDSPSLETKQQHHRVNFTSWKSDSNSTTNENEISASTSKEKVFPRQLPNYDEAVQRVSLLRWASLQKLPTKSSSSENRRSSPSDEFSPTKDLSPSEIFSSSPQPPAPTYTSHMANGRVGQRVRSFEAKVNSLSSGSNSSSIVTDRLSNSWNPILSNSVNSGNNCDWLRQVNSPTDNSKDNGYVGSGTGIHATSVSSSVVNHNDKSGENGSVFRLRRDDSSTLSDDVFAHDDSRENFADISWSPVVPSEEKNIEKNTFLTVPTLPPKPSATASSRAPPLPISHRHRSTLDPNVSSGLRHSGRYDRNTMNSSVNDRNNDGVGNSRNTRNNNSLGDNANNPSTLQNGKRVVIEVLV